MLVKIRAYSTLDRTETDTCLVNTALVTHVCNISGAPGTRRIFLVGGHDIETPLTLDELLARLAE